LRIEYHRTLINDRVRVAAFHEALRRTIVPGESVVADIGAGTGLLGAMAARLGARKVYLYEAGEIAGVAADVLRKNRIKNAELFACHSTEFEDPPRADIVVSETLGNYALEEDIIETMADAAKRHLKPGGRLLPARLAQFAAAVTAPRIDLELRAWDRATAGLAEIDLSPARTFTLNNIYVRAVAPAELLQNQGAPRVVEWDRIELGRDARSNRKGEVAFALARKETIYGFALWWTAELLPGLVLSTAPDAPATHWEQLYLPLIEPIAAETGDSVTLTVKSRTGRETGTTIAWSATHARASGETVSRQNMDLEKGYLP
jgi:protein arginine N-methyltransferase 1